MNTMTTRFVKNLVMYHVPGTVLIIYNLFTHLHDIGPIARRNIK